MKIINIIFIILTIIMLSALLYLIISSALKTKEVIAEENNAKLESSSLIETFTDDGYLKTYRYPDLTFNKNNKNIPIAINPNLSECKSDVLNYDEINLIHPRNFEKEAHIKD